jgi:hypothetical protein
MTRTLLRLFAIAAFLQPLTGCVVYEPVPVSAPSQPTPQQRFDRSWAAASGAMYDQGVNVTTQDRGSGVIRGERGGVTVTAVVETRPDGRIQVKFDSAGDPALVQRVSESYERRMGR